MIRTFCKLAIGLTLTGCMVNSIHNDNYSVAYKISHREVTVVGGQEQPKASASVEVVPTVVTGNMHIRPECGPYVPLTMPEPIKIDMVKLQQAQSSQEINKIVLDNVKDLRNQMISFSLRQQRHYADYVRRCVKK